MLLFVDRVKLRKNERIKLEYQYRATIIHCDKSKVALIGNIEDITEDGMKFIMDSREYSGGYANSDIVTIKIETVGIMRGEIKWLYEENGKTSLGIVFQNLSVNVFMSINNIRLEAIALRDRK
ncbi:PilZ domain-containing protein [bacterium]|nr:PilZ domain-containing protein [bacterium]